MNKQIKILKEETLFIRYKKPNELSLSTEFFLNYEYTFISKVRQCVLENLENESFNIEHICLTLGISRSQMHNKIKFVTGNSTSHFIRFIRLEKAVQLLEQTDLNLTEITYKVGFKSLNYFSKSFLNKYGIRPSEWRKRLLINC